MRTSTESGAPRVKVHAKKDFPVAEIRRLLEPGPIVLVSSAWRRETNIMTMGWHTVMEFTPSLVGCVISSANHSFDLTCCDLARRASRRNRQAEEPPRRQGRQEEMGRAVPTSSKDLALRHRDSRWVRIFSVGGFVLQ